ncbi:helix-turn-helix domain-containing protein [Polaromonas jejuensis]|uniref:Helix-turn-helix domain-containing protein n=1 Tax=Polaromonas jejuensis TaxID=457502 RepID=A0ABW0Q9R6_9BURK|nr:helix-turn-helix domain-containing protein [Polaromonas jejuensis]
MKYNRWSTLHIAPRHRAEFWRSANQEAIVPLTPHIPRLDDFQAEITHRGLDNLVLNQVQVQAPSHDMERTAADLARGGPACVFANLYLSGQTQALQSGSEITAKPGELFLIDGCEQYRLNHPNPVSLLVLGVPYAALGALGPALSALTARRLPERASVQLLASQMRTLSTWPHALQAAESARVSDLLVSTLQAVLLDATEDSAGARKERRFLRRKVQQLIERQYADPALSPAAVAHQMGVSVRTLHARLAQDGTSFGAELMAHRLQRAYTMLQGAPQHSTTVIAIAALCGFSSAAHFSRRFRARYGMPPGALLRAG